MTTHFETHGFDVLRGFFEPSSLSTEVDACLREAFTGEGSRLSGRTGNRFRYVPTMCERTPVSLTLVTRLAAVAAALLGTTALPSRAKITEYRGATGWHRDSELSMRSVGFAAYLEPLDGPTGALRVLPGSQLHDAGLAVIDALSAGVMVPGVVVPTLPGDVIALDERLFHASSGGDVRRQWRVDFVADDAGDDALRAYFGRQYAPGWDGGYDVKRYPSYGPHWRTLDARWNARLEALGAYALADREEADVLAKRSGVAR